MPATVENVRIELLIANAEEYCRYGALAVVELKENGRLCSTYSCPIEIHRASGQARVDKSDLGWLVTYRRILHDIHVVIALTFPVALVVQ